MTEKQNKYALVHLNERGYKSIGSRVMEEVAKELEPVMLKGVEQAVKALIRPLISVRAAFEPPREDAPYLTDLVTKAVKRLLAEDMNITDERVAEILVGYEQRGVTLNSVARRAQEISYVLGEITMSGNPHQISQLTDFFNWLKRVGPEE